VEKNDSNDFTFLWLSEGLRTVLYSQVSLWDIAAIKAKRSKVPEKPREVRTVSLWPIKTQRHLKKMLVKEENKHKEYLKIRKKPFMVKIQYLLKGFLSYFLFFGLFLLQHFPHGHRWSVRKFGTAPLVNPLLEEEEREVNG
jgi:hypothetical protein